MKIIIFAEFIDGLIDYPINCASQDMLDSRAGYDQGPVVQSVVSLTSLLVVKMFTVLVSTISNSQVFLLQFFFFFFSKHISVFAIFNDQSFNNTLTNDIVSFEQLDPEKKNNDNRY